MAVGNHPEGRLLELSRALQHGRLPQIRSSLNALHPAEIAHLLASLPPAQRKLAWELVDPELDGEVLVHTQDEVRADLIRDMDAAELIAAMEGMDLDDLADLLQDLPETVVREVLRSMDRQNRARLEQVLAWPEDSAGGLMNPDMITVRADVTLEVVLRYMRLLGELPEGTDALFVVDRNDLLLGRLPLNLVLTEEPSRLVAEVMQRELTPIRADTSAHDVARTFQDRDLISAPVVNHADQLLGRVTIDDVVDVIRAEADQALLGRAGLRADEDLFAPLWSSARRRALWVGVSLATAFIAARVVGMFEAAIEQVVALAVLMPIVASMGGVAGNQTLTLVVRGLALGQIGAGNTRWLLLRELGVTWLNGLLWATLVGLIAWWWFALPALGLIIATALMINLGCAALAGVLIPLVQRRLGIDPAIAGTVVLTTVTDVVGFLSFLGLGSVFLL